MIIADMHTHSSFSGDSEAPMETQIEKAIELGLKHYCFTDHEDLYYPEVQDENGNSVNIFSLDISAYLAKLTELKTRYKDKLNILKGIELGLSKKALPKYEELLKWIHTILNSGSIMTARLR